MHWQEKRPAAEHHFLHAKDSVYIKIKSRTVKTSSGFGTDIFYVGA